MKKFRQIPMPDNLYAAMLKEGSLWVKHFVSNDGFSVLYSLDRTQHGTLHHMSVSRKDRHPNWIEISQAKEVIMGDIDVMMILPKKIDYVNVDKNCFHLWETPVEWNVR